MQLFKVDGLSDFNQKHFEYMIQIRDVIDNNNLSLLNIYSNIYKIEHYSSRRLC